MKSFTVIGIYPDGCPERMAVESFVEHVWADTPKGAARVAVAMADGRDLDYVIAVFKGDHNDQYDPEA